MHLPVDASSRNCWLLRADKSQGAHSSLPVASCNYLMAPRSWSEFMTPHSCCTSSDWKVFANKGSDGRIRGPSSVCCSTEYGLEKDVCGCSRSRANARSTFYNTASIRICQPGNNRWFKITPHPHSFFSLPRKCLQERYWTSSSQGVCYCYQNLTLSQRPVCAGLARYTNLPRATCAVLPKARLALSAWIDQASWLSCTSSSSCKFLLALMKPLFVLGMYDNHRWCS